jgi:hypothetical protein
VISIWVHYYRDKKVVQCLCAFSLHFSINSHGNWELTSTQLLNELSVVLTDDMELEKKHLRPNPGENLVFASPKQWGWFCSRT